MRFVELSVHVLFSILVLESESCAEGGTGMFSQRDEPFDMLDGCSAVLWGIRLIQGKDG